MGYSWQVVFDCSDSVALADFWAAALEYVVEDQKVLIDQLLAAGQVAPEAVVEHGGLKTFKGLTVIRDPEAPFNPVTGGGEGRRILFQEVPEAKTVKNRVHLDIHHGDEGLEGLVQRLEKLGAQRVNEVDEGMAGHWWVMRDPEGNEFCAA